jgi:DNA-binding NarL/FixJ family response regulator
MPNPIRLLIAEDHDLVGQGLRSMLQGKALEVVGIVRDGKAVPGEVSRTRPDVLLLDLSLPNRSGIELIPELSTLAPLMHILVVTMHVDRVLADSAIRLGAHGFVPKDAGIDELRLAIAEVCAGRIYLSPHIPPRTYRGMGPEGGIPGSRSLTPRQVAILRMIGQGMSTEAIAETLGVSIHTVHFHRRNIHGVLGLKTELELVRYAVLVTLAEPQQH